MKNMFSSLALWKIDRVTVSLLDFVGISVYLKMQLSSYRNEVFNYCELVEEF